MTEQKKHLNITISGRVQGVGFRSAARTMAISLGIRGSVKNLYTGNVYIEAEGTEIQLKYFIEWCYKGPSYATVHNVQIENSEVKDFIYFDIIH